MPCIGFGKGFWSSLAVHDDVQKATRFEVLLQRVEGFCRRATTAWARIGSGRFINGCRCVIMLILCCHEIPVDRSGDPVPGFRVVSNEDLDTTRLYLEVSDYPESRAVFT